MNEESYVVSFRTYKIPVTYKSWGLIEVEASSLEEAIQMALAGGLPPWPEYLEDSLRIDYDGLSCHNEDLTEEEIYDAEREGQDEPT